MASAISFSNIVTTYPIPGRDNDSQGFRTNFSLIKDGLETAASEISLLQANKADLIEQSVFTNTTPSFSTATGAVVVAGGLGIGGDVYIGGNLSVNGGDALTSATIVSSTATDVIMTGTFGAPQFTLASTLGGNKTWRGRQIFSPNSSYDTAETSSTVFISTTASNASTILNGLFVKLNSGNAVGSSALKINTVSQNDHFIRFVGGLGQTEAGKITLGPDSTLIFNTVNTLTFTSNVLINNGLSIAAGGAVISGGLRISGPTTIATTSTTGIAGQIAWDTDFIYVCVGTNQWKRASLNSW